MPKIGFIGLGTMGRPMARNLLKAGHELFFFARRDDVAAEFAAAGARRAATPAELMRQCDIAVTIVTADAQVTELTLGPQGLIAGAGPGKTLIEMSTIGPDTVRAIAARLAEAGMAMIDAPVSGGPWGAEAGTLTIMVGGQAEVVDRCREVLQAMGQRIFHVGPIGSGQIVKLVNQMVGGSIMAVVGEGMVLARKAGIDPAMLLEVMQVSSGSSAVLEARGKKFILADRFEPGFMTELMHKDVALALALAGELKVPTPIAAAALAQYTAALAQGYGAMDFAAVVKIAEQAAAVQIVP